MISYSLLPSFISSSGKGSGAGSRASAGVPWFSLAASASGSFSKPCTPGYRERMGWLVGEGRGSLGLVVGYLFLVHLRELLSQNPSSSCTVVAWENVSNLLIDLYSSVFHKTRSFGTAETRRCLGNKWVIAMWTFSCKVQAISSTPVYISQMLFPEVAKKSWKCYMYCKRTEFIRVFTKTTWRGNLLFPPCPPWCSRRVQWSQPQNSKGSRPQYMMLHCQYKTNIQ